MAEEKCRKIYWYYMMAIPGWFLLFWFLFGSLFNKTPYLFSHVLCMAILAVNIWKQWEPYQPGEYTLEEKVYEYVERNTYYLIMAITIFLLISANRDNGPFKVVDFNLVVYSQACAIALCVIVLALFWMSTKKGKLSHLVHLRHVKTVIFTYALSLFFISPIEILLKLKGAF